MVPQTLPDLVTGLEESKIEGAALTSSVWVRSRGSGLSKLADTLAERLR